MYASSSGNSYGYGFAIYPLSLEAAKAWAESRLDGDDFEEIFGAVEE